MSPARTVVLISHGEFPSGARRAHLHGLGRCLGDDALVHHVALVSPRLFATPAARRVLDAEAARARSAFSGRVVHLPCSPRGAWPAVDARLLARALAGLAAPREPLVLHGRGARAVLVAATARELLGTSRAKLLHDVRGATDEEAAPHGPVAVARRRGEEAAACRAAEGHACVSGALAERLRDRHGVRDAEVFPCAADTERFSPDEDAGAKRRLELGLPGRAFLLGYLGSAAHWQRPDALLRLRARLAADAPSLHLLVLSPDVDRFRALLRAAGVAVRPGPGGATVRESAPEDVPGWLSACDATALLRTRDAINAVASPVKFGESLACGTPVIVTRGIGDTSDVVERHGVGLVLDSADDLGANATGALDVLPPRASARGRALGLRCREVAVALWSWSSQRERWLALYDRLIG